MSIDRIRLLPGVGARRDSVRIARPPAERSTSS
jgi:hypothetical protein